MGKLDLLTAVTFWQFLPSLGCRVVFWMILAFQVFSPSPFLCLLNERRGGEGKGKREYEGEGKRRMGREERGEEVR